MSTSSLLAKPASPSYLTCANINSTDPSQTCVNPGTLKCSKCHLVPYCSKACQINHWPTHRRDCKSSFLKADWKPLWASERRQPAFISDGQRPEASSPFGRSGHCVWGNVAASDCLNLPFNEGISNSTTTDFKICFAASGDIGNLVQTINNLPDDYQGKCNVLFNDRDHVVVHRNVIILLALANPLLNLDAAAEHAMHLMYSAALSPATSAYFDMLVSLAYTRVGLDEDTLGSYSLDTRGSGKMHLLYRQGDLTGVLEMFNSTYGLENARADMYSIMLNPARVDYRDRYLDTLRPSHRMSFMRFRETCVLAPYSADKSTFTEPNRLLFSASGQWLPMDSSNPLAGWDVATVLASGQRHGVDPADVYGCLHFHVRDIFKEFAKKIQNLNIHIHITQFDAHALSLYVQSGHFNPFGKNCFDRVETSNIADYVGAAAVIKDWGNLLSRRNKHAALLMYFMNWYVKETGGDLPYNDSRVMRPLLAKTAAALGLGAEDLAVEGSHQRLRIQGHIHTFYNNTTAFENFLSRNANEMLGVNGLRVRPKNLIRPKRVGIPLNKQRLQIPELTIGEFYNTFILGAADAPVRFIEVEVV